MATIKYLLKGKSNPSTIYLRLKSGRDIDITKSTGYVIEPVNWSYAKKSVKVTKDARLKKLDKNLNDLKSHLLLSLSNSEKHHITKDWLQNEIATFKGEISKNKEISDFVSDYIQHIMKTAHTKLNGKGGIGLSKSRIKSYGNLLNMFNRYQGGKRIRIREIDTTFANKFLNWMLEQKYSKSYSLKILSDLKTTCNDAGYYGIETSIQLKNIKAPSIQNESIIYLSFEELDTIEHTPLKREALINARRWLILGCHIGQRGSDLLNLTEENLKSKNNDIFIELTQSKGNKTVAIPLPKKAQEILTDGFPKPIHLNTFNKHIKEICRLAKIDTPTKGRKSIGKRDKRHEGTFPKYELISSHVCRRSYATNYYSKIPTPYLKNVTGHSTEKMLLKYIGKTSEDYILEIADLYKKIQNDNTKTIKMGVIKKLKSAK